jgi:hypothetical protein
MPEPHCLNARRVDPGRGDIGPVETGMIDDRAAKIAAAANGLKLVERPCFSRCFAELLQKS